jgi:hypothetical protein
MGAGYFYGLTSIVKKGVIDSFSYPLPSKKLSQFFTNVKC